MKNPKKLIWPGIWLATLITFYFLLRSAQMKYEKRIQLEEHAMEMSFTTLKMVLEVDIKSLEECKADTAFERSQFDVYEGIAKKFEFESSLNLLIPLLCMLKINDTNSEDMRYMMNEYFHLSHAVKQYELNRIRPIKLTKADFDTLIVKHREFLRLIERIEAVKGG